MNIKLRLKIVEKFRTQEQFAVVSGISEAIVSKLIRELRRPTKRQREIISELLDTPAERLFDQ